jgi:hypothetical protein
MEPNYYDRFDLLLEMARYLSQDWNTKLEKSKKNPLLLSTERRCWMHIYTLMSNLKDNDTLINQADSCFISYKELANAPLSYPYLQDLSSCQHELWRLFTYYNETEDENFMTPDSRRSMKSFILKLLLQKSWNNADRKSAETIIQHAILYHLFLPAIAAENCNSCSNSDIPPF